jgi:molecular chaperone DnaK (HSP70)
MFLTVASSRVLSVLLFRGLSTLARRPSAEADKADEVIHVSGMSRMPCVINLILKAVFSRELSTSVSPDEAVVITVSIQAGVLAGNVANIRVLGVTPQKEERGEGLELVGVQC